jgi:hypothetical protein
MAKMRKRVAIKWNNEALVEKCCNCLGALVAKFFVDISYRNLLIGFGCIFVQVSVGGLVCYVVASLVPQLTPSPPPLPPLTGIRQRHHDNPLVQVEVED